jgi:hypothetical protein
MTFPASRLGSPSGCRSNGARARLVMVRLWDGSPVRASLSHLDSGTFASVAATMRSRYRRASSRAGIGALEADPVDSHHMPPRPASAGIRLGPATPRPGRAGHFKPGTWRILGPGYSIITRSPRGSHSVVAEHKRVTAKLESRPARVLPGQSPPQPRRLRGSQTERLRRHRPPVAGVSRAARRSAAPAWREAWISRIAPRAAAARKKTEHY